MTDGAADQEYLSHPFWWDLSCEMARWLRNADNVPPPVNLQGPILQPGEVGRLAAPHARYDRLYGGSGSYRTTTPFVAGSTSFIAGVWGAALLANEYRRRQAELNAQVRWRDESSAVVYVTSQRVITALPDKTLDFWFSRVSAFHVDFDQWSLMLEFTGEAGPLRLAGPPAPAVALWIAYGLFGPAWKDDPRFDRLG